MSPTTSRKIAPPATCSIKPKADRDRQAAKEHRQRVPAIKHVEHSLRFLHLVGYCQAFVAGINRCLPELRNHPLSEDERDVIHHNLDRVHAAADFCRRDHR